MKTKAKALKPIITKEVYFALTKEAQDRIPIGDYLRHKWGLDSFIDWDGRRSYERQYKKLFPRYCIG
jgi:hypothetical protein